MNVKNRSDKTRTIKNARDKRTNRRLRISLTEDCILSLEFVAHAMHGDDQIVRLEFVAQVADMGIDGTLITFKRDTVRGIQQLITGENSTWLTHQSCHDLKLCRG